MKIKVVIHEDDDGGFWAEVPGIPGCTTRAKSWDELLEKLHLSIEGCLAAHLDTEELGNRDQVVELAL